eukprot:TRINITY_DN12621_c0_g1_i5.p1 TRINITY_DN12621_c0_g1~~TRINITY_DN12621_c0_g1_i5.p1  ORF type:complete len:1376 (+),score=258.93 TRINITY_DN12621_c0_g1_i5:633-4760(+)
MERLKLLGLSDHEQEVYTRWCQKHGVAASPPPPGLPEQVCLLERQADQIAALHDELKSLQTECVGPLSNALCKWINGDESSVLVKGVIELEVEGCCGPGIINKSLMTAKEQLTNLDAIMSSPGPAFPDLFGVAIFDDTTLLQGRIKALHAQLQKLDSSWEYIQTLWLDEYSNPNGFDLIGTLSSVYQPMHMMNESLHHWLDDCERLGWKEFQHLGPLIAKIIIMAEVTYLDSDTASMMEIEQAAGLWKLLSQRRSACTRDLLALYEDRIPWWHIETKFNASTVCSQEEELNHASRHVLGRLLGKVPSTETPVTRNELQKALASLRVTQVANVDHELKRTYQLNLAVDNIKLLAAQLRSNYLSPISSVIGPWHLGRTTNSELLGCVLEYVLCQTGPVNCLKERLCAQLSALHPFASILRFGDNSFQTERAEGLVYQYLAGLSSTAEREVSDIVLELDKIRLYWEATKDKIDLEERRDPASRLEDDCGDALINERVHYENLGLANLALSLQSWKATCATEQLKELEHVGLVLAQLRIVEPVHEGENSCLAALKDLAQLPLEEFKATYKKEHQERQHWITEIKVRLAEQELELNVHDALEKTFQELLGRNEYIEQLCTRPLQQRAASTPSPKLAPGSLQTTACEGQLHGHSGCSRVPQPMATDKSGSSLSTTIPAPVEASVIAAGPIPVVSGRSRRLLPHAPAKPALHRATATTATTAVTAVGTVTASTNRDGGRKDVSIQSGRGALPHTPVPGDPSRVQPELDYVSRKFNGESKLKAAQNAIAKTKGALQKAGLLHTLSAILLAEFKYEGKTGSIRLRMEDGDKVVEIMTKSVQSRWQLFAVPLFKTACGDRTFTTLTCFTTSSGVAQTSLLDLGCDGALISMGAEQLSVRAASMFDMHMSSPFPPNLASNGITMRQLDAINTIYCCGLYGLPGESVITMIEPFVQATLPAENGTLQVKQLHRNLRRIAYGGGYTGKLATLLYRFLVLSRQGKCALDSNAASRMGSALRMAFARFRDDLHSKSSDCLQALMRLQILINVTPTDGVYSFHEPLDEIWNATVAAQDEEYRSSISARVEKAPLPVNLQPAGGFDAEFAQNEQPHQLSAYVSYGAVSEKDTIRKAVRDEHDHRPIDDGRFRFMLSRNNDFHQALVFGMNDQMVVSSQVKLGSGQWQVQYGRTTRTRNLKGPTIITPTNDFKPSGVGSKFDPFGRAELEFRLRGRTVWATFSLYELFDPELDVKQLDAQQLDNLARTFKRARSDVFFSGDVGADAQDQQVLAGNVLCLEGAINIQQARQQHDIYAAEVGFEYRGVAQCIQMLLRLPQVWRSAIVNGYRNPTKDSRPLSMVSQQAAFLLRALIDLPQITAERLQDIKLALATE